MRLWALFFLEVAAFGGTAGALTLGARAYHSHTGAATYQAAPERSGGGPLWPSYEPTLAPSAVAIVLSLTSTRAIWPLTTMK